MSSTLLDASEGKFEVRIRDGPVSEDVKRRGEEAHARLIKTLEECNYTIEV